MGRLDGQKIAVLATDGFEEVELTDPVEALRREGAQVEVVSTKGGKIQGYRHHDKGGEVEVDVTLDAVNPRDYDGLVLPGGVINPDALRLAPRAIDFVKSFVDGHRPIAAICHGPWTLIDAGGVRGKRMTSWPSLKTDLSNAGANWVDEQVVVDGNLVTSRRPDDLQAFDTHMVELFAQRVTARPDPAAVK
jgi:protease I